MNSEQHLIQQERKGQEWMPKLQWENKQNWEDKNNQAKASGKDYKKQQNKIMSSFLSPKAEVHTISSDEEFFR